MAKEIKKVTDMSMEELLDYGLITEKQYNSGTVFLNELVGVPKDLRIDGVKWDIPEHKTYFGNLLGWERLYDPRDTMEPIVRKRQRDYISKMKEISKNFPV